MYISVLSAEMSTAFHGTCILDWIHVFVKVVALLLRIAQRKARLNPVNLGKLPANLVCF